MEGSLLIKQKKQPPIPTMGQELRSCDTTQIDEKSSARLCVPSYAPRLITGGIPSASTQAFRFFKPPSEVHSLRAADRDLTTHGSLNAGLPKLLLFVTGLMLQL